MLLAGGELDPRVLPGLAALYLDPDTTTARSGANVTAWSAANSGGPTLTPSGTQPTYNATGFQSRPAVMFSLSPLGGTLAITGARSIFAVYQTGATGSQQVARMGDLTLQYNAVAGYRAFTPDAESNSLDTTAAVPIIESGVFSGSAVTERHIRGGTLLGGPTSGAATAAGSDVSIGGGTGLNGGAVAAVAFYSRALTTDDMLFLEAWAHRKYGITVPSGNPYV